MNLEVYWSPRLAIAVSAEVEDPVHRARREGERERKGEREKERERERKRKRGRESMYHTALAQHFCLARESGWRD